MDVIYQITYPNGKIYIGQDRTDSINYHQSQTLDDRWRSLPGRKGEALWADGCHPVTAV
jgi:hypothetical protein